MTAGSRLSKQLNELSGRFSPGPLTAVDATTILTPKQVIPGNVNRSALMLQCTGVQSIQITPGGNAVGANYFVLSPGLNPWTVTFQDIGPIVQMPWFLWGAGPGPAFLVWMELVINPQGGE